MGWTGSNCSIPLCYEIPANDIRVCNGLGTCISNNTCVCKSGVIGSLCSSIAIVGNDTTGRRYADGTSAKTCKEYLFPSNTTYIYNGSIGSGYYWIKPDSTELKVYCEMKAGGGGLTSLTRVQNSILNSGTQSRYYLYLKDTNTWYKSPLTTITWDWNSFKARLVV